MRTEDCAEAFRNEDAATFSKHFNPLILFNALFLIIEGGCQEYRDLPEGVRGSGGGRLCCLEYRDLPEGVRGRGGEGCAAIFTLPP